MKPLLAALILSTALAGLPLPVSAREIPARGPFRTWAWCKDFTLGTRPADAKGHEGSYDLWMQMPDSGPGGAGKEIRIGPIPFPGAKDGTLRITYPPDGLVSPDARRVAASQKICRGYAVAYVLQRNEEEEYERQGFNPLPKLVSEMGWDKFFEENPDQVGKRGEMDGVTSFFESSICDLVAWEPDSSGVWFSLRGGDRRKDKEGILHWYFLWEAKTGKVVVPERVKTINRFAATRWTPNPDKKLLSKEAAAAEVQHYVFLADVKQRLADPDRLIKRETLEQEARVRFDRFRRADRGGEPKGLSVSDARTIIPRDSLCRASLKEGAAATLEDR